MSKLRDRTTAVPGPNKRSSVKRLPSRSEREQQANRILTLAIALIFGMIVVLVGGALFIEDVFTPNQPVASVNGQGISTRDFQSRVRFERWRTGTQLAALVNQYGVDQLGLNNSQSQFGQLYQQLSTPTTMGSTVLTEMINAKLIDQYAAANGITVSQADIDKESFTFFGYEPNPQTATPTTTPTLTLTPLVSETPTPTSTPTVVPSITPTIQPPTATDIPTGIPTATPGATEQRKNYDTNVQSYLDQAAKQVGYTQADLNEIFREQALQKKVLQKIAGDPLKEQEQSKVRHILLSTEQDAKDVMAALQAGESFAALAKADSQDNGQQAGQQTSTAPSGGSAAQGGELGWAGRDASYVKEFNDAIWNAKPGEVVGPIKTQFGYHIIQVEARETRQLTSQDALTKQTTIFDNWLKDQATKNSTQYSYWIDRVPSDPTLQQLGLPTPDQLPAAPQQSPLGSSSSPLGG